MESTRATSRLEELRLQGGQLHRGLRSIAGGIQGISPIEDYHQLQPGGIRSCEGHFSEELRGKSVISFNHAIMLWSLKEESWWRSKNLPWTSMQHSCKDPFGGLMSVESVKPNVRLGYRDVCISAIYSNEVVKMEKIGRPAGGCVLFYEQEDRIGI